VTDAPNGPWFSLTFRRNEGAADLTYTVQATSDLINWTNLVPDGQNVVEETVNADPDGDGSAIVKRVAEFGQSPELIPQLTEFVRPLAIAAHGG